MSLQTAKFTPKAGQVNLALLFLRIASALAFLYHGSAILFGAFGGPGPTAFAGYMHVPPVIGFLVGLAQFGGGLAMISGILIRVGAAGIMTVMAGAIILVHLPNGFNISHNGMEYALTQFLIALSILLTGAGAYSLGRFLPATLRKW